MIGDAKGDSSNWLRRGCCLNSLILLPDRVSWSNDSSSSGHWLHLFWPSHDRSSDPSNKISSNTVAISSSPSTHQRACCRQIALPTVWNEQNSQRKISWMRCGVIGLVCSL